MSKMRLWQRRKAHVCSAGAAIERVGETKAWQ